MPQIGQHKLVELLYNVRRAEFNSEVDAESARPTFEDVNDDRLKESITAEIRAYYDDAKSTGDVVVDAILETLR